MAMEHLIIPSRGQSRLHQALTIAAITGAAAPPLRQDYKPHHATSHLLLGGLEHFLFFLILGIKKTS